MHLKLSSAKWRPSSLPWRHNGLDSVPNHQPHHCLLSRLFGRRSKKTSKLRVTGLCAWNSPGTGEFPAQRASYAENVSIWWRHHVVKGRWVKENNTTVYIPMVPGMVSRIFCINYIICFCFNLESYKGHGRFDCWAIKNNSIRNQP